MKRINDSLCCCYCGGKATTKEHIPPKGIFNKPLPNDLITVPCCHSCNLNGSVNDEAFKVFLGLHVARAKGEAERLFKEGVLSTTRHNKKLRQKIINAMRPVYIKTESGIITGKGAEITWDSDVHDIAIERIARGLFYFHYKKPLLNIAKKSIYWFESQLEYNVVILDGWSHNAISNGAFSYYYGATDDESGSIWIFNFYNSHFAAAILTTADF